MFIMGDEYGHTKIGNNNTYCHDSEINWFNWNAVRNEKHFSSDDTHTYQYVRKIILLRRAHPQFRQKKFFVGYDIKSYDSRAHTTNYADHDRLVVLAISKQKENDINDLLVVFNTSHITRIVELPKWLRPTKTLKYTYRLLQKMCWVPLVNTSIPPQTHFVFEREIIIIKLRK
jgi:pullulanase/glycogen debranching enzyme